MGKYIKLFETTSQYNAYTADTANFITPNVSLAMDAPTSVYYSPWVETRAVAKFNVTDTSSPTKIIGVYADSPFSAIEIDGVEQPSVASAYTFSTTGEHTVKYTLTDPTSIGNGAFFSCTTLTSIDIPNSVTSIGDYAFSSCRGLTSIVIPNSVTSIGSNAFYGCSGITSIVIPNSVTSIGYSAFDNTPWWNSYSADTSHYYGNVIYINDVAYKATATTITSAELKDSTVGIGGSAFSSCSGLTSIEIPNGVTSIGQNAFGHCSGLTSIDIPNSVTSIGMTAFYYCSGLTSCTIGSGVTSIGSGAFSGCTTLTSCTIGSGVTSIGDSAFADCRSLTSIEIPNSVTSIGQNAFGHCSGLTSCTLGSGVTSIGNSAFTFCYSLTSIDIPNSVTSIGTYAFGYCSGLTSIVCNAATAPTITSNTFRNVKTGGTLTVPIGSTGYDVWMGTGNYYLGLYSWTKVEQ